MPEPNQTKSPAQDKFSQSLETVKRDETAESWRDLKPKAQRDRLRAMYAEVKVEQ